MPPTPKKSTDKSFFDNAYAVIGAVILIFSAGVSVGIFIKNNNCENEKNAINLEHSQEIQIMRDEVNKIRMENYEEGMNEIKQTVKDLQTKFNAK